MTADELAALREVDALTPGSPALAPPPPPRVVPWWERVGGRLDVATQMIHVPGFEPCDRRALELHGPDALRPLP